MLALKEYTEIDVKKEPIFGDVLADTENGYDPLIIANPNGQIKSLHAGSEGFIALFQKKGEYTSQDDQEFLDPLQSRHGYRDYSQYHYKFENIKEPASDWVYSNWRTHNSYVSMNTFYTPKRLITNLKEIRNMYVDIDCHNIGKSAEELDYILKESYYGKSIPHPNMIIFSGRGLNLIWYIEPLSGLAVERWGRIQNELYKVLEKFGADKKALDASRIFRLAGSHNMKNGSQVYCVVHHEQRYKFEELVKDYFPKSVKQIRKPSKVDKKVGKWKTKGAVKHMRTERTLLIARINDLDTLVRLRSGKMQGHREYILFLKRYWSLVLRGNQEEALNATLALNNSFAVPLPEREAIGDTKSAERYYESGVPFKTTHALLIKWFGITKDEEKHLSTIISKSEVRQRDTKSRRDKRRAEGVLERSEYEENRQLQKAHRVSELRKLQLKHPDATQKMLAEMLGVSLRTLKNYAAEIRSGERGNGVSACIERETPLTLSLGLGEGLILPSLLIKRE